MWINKVKHIMLDVYLKYCHNPWSSDWLNFKQLVNVQFHGAWYHVCLVWRETPETQLKGHEKHFYDQKVESIISWKANVVNLRLPPGIYIDNCAKIEQIPSGTRRTEKYTTWKLNAFSYSCSEGAHKPWRRQSSVTLG